MLHFLQIPFKLYMGAAVYDMVPNVLARFVLW